MSTQRWPTEPNAPPPTTSPSLFDVLPQNPSPPGWYPGPTGSLWWWDGERWLMPAVERNMATPSLQLPTERHGQGGWWSWPSAIVGAAAGAIGVVFLFTILGLIVGGQQ